MRKQRNKAVHNRRTTASPQCTWVGKLEVVHSPGAFLEKAGPVPSWDGLGTAACFCRALAQVALVVPALGFPICL